MAKITDNMDLSNLSSTEIQNSVTDVRTVIKQATAEKVCETLVAIATPATLKSHTTTKKTFKKTFMIPAITIKIIG